MAINLIKIGNTYNVPIKEFQIDSADDVQNLPIDCPVGSKALDVSTGNWYRFISTKEWTISVESVHVDIPTAEEGEF